MRLILLPTILLLLAQPPGVIRMQPQGGEQIDVVKITPGAKTPSELMIAVSGQVNSLSRICLNPQQGNEAKGVTRCYYVGDLREGTPQPFVAVPK